MHIRHFFQPEGRQDKDTPAASNAVFALVTFFSSWAHKINPIHREYYLNLLLEHILIPGTLVFTQTKKQAKAWTLLLQVFFENAPFFIIILHQIAYVSPTNVTSKLLSVALHHLKRLPTAVASPTHFWKNSLEAVSSCLHPLIAFGGPVQLLPDICECALEGITPSDFPRARTSFYFFFRLFSLVPFFNVPNPDRTPPPSSPSGMKIPVSSAAGERRRRSRSSSTSTSTTPPTVSPSVTPNPDDTNNRSTHFLLSLSERLNEIPVQFFKQVLRFLESDEKREEGASFAMQIAILPFFSQLTSSLHKECVWLLAEALTSLPFSSRKSIGFVINSAVVGEPQQAQDILIPIILDKLLPNWRSHETEAKLCGKFPSSSFFFHSSYCLKSSQMKIVL